MKIVRDNRLGSWSLTASLISCHLALLNGTSPRQSHLTDLTKTSVSCADGMDHGAGQPKPAEEHHAEIRLFQLIGDCDRRTVGLLFWSWIFLRFIQWHLFQAATTLCHLHHLLSNAAGIYRFVAVFRKDAFVADNRVHLCQPPRLKRVLVWTLWHFLFTHLVFLPQCNHFRK